MEDLMLFAGISYFIACIVVATGHSNRYSGAETFFMALFCTPVIAVLMNILAKLSDHSEPRVPAFKIQKYGLKDVGDRYGLEARMKHNK